MDWEETLRVEETSIREEKQIGWKSQLLRRKSDRLGGKLRDFNIQSVGGNQIGVRKADRLGGKLRDLEGKQVD